MALRVHPLALKVAGTRSPQTGLKSKWSLYHSAAVALCDGTAGERQYTDERAHDPVVQQVRDRVTAETDPGLREAEAHVAITLVDGCRVELHIEHAVGSTGNPMSDRDLERKFHDLAQGVLPPSRINTLIGKCWEMAQLPDAAELARLAVP